VVGGSKNGEPDIPKIGCLFPPKSTMELYKYSMWNIKNVSSQQTEMTIMFVSEK
jgi:hypothetical protein